MNKKVVFLAFLSLFSLAGRAQKIEADNTLVDCGQIIFRQPMKTEFKLRNTGRKPLIIKDVRTSCGCTAVDYPRTSVAPGDEFTLTAVYDAKQMGHFNKQIGLYTNGSDEPLMLTIRGVVVEELVDFAGKYPYKLGDLDVDIRDVEFDDVNKGDRPYQRIHFFNNTSETVEPVVMHLPNYLSAEVSPSKVAPGHGGTATLILDPRKLHDFGLTQTSVYLGLFPGDRVSSEKEVTVSAVLLPNFENMTETQRELAPKMKLSAEVLDLGAFDGKKKRKGEIEITNTGRTTLDIRSLQMFTTGIEVSLSNTKIAPGETAKMKVTAIAKQLKTVRSQPRILMITNDPDHAKVVIKVLVKK